MPNIDSAGDVPKEVWTFTKDRHADTYPFIDPANANLHGRNVLITGASRGCGLATAISYAKAGASGIAISARSSLSSVVKDIQAAAKKTGHPEPKVLPLQMDVASFKSVQKCRNTLNETFHGQLDVVIANAGILENWLPITESDPDEWWQSWEVNVKGAYLTAREFLPLLQKQNSLGIFIGLSSIGAHLFRDGASAYQSAKFVLNKIAEFITYETATKERSGEGKSVQAFCIHPGGVMTELAGNMPKEMHGILTDTPELCGDTIVWLTKERRDWIKGRYISVNWDMQELESRKEEILERDSLKMRMTL